MNDLKTSFVTDTLLPLVIEPKRQSTKFTDLLTLLHENNSYFKQQILANGGILLRGFPVENADDFAKVIRTLNIGKALDYIGGDSPRTKIKDGVYTSTEAPPYIKIPLHNELSFAKNYPTHIYFFCETPAATGGETILGDARKIHDAIDAGVRDRWNQRSLKYISRYPYKSKIIEMINPFHKSWTDVFETHDKEEVSRKCCTNEFQLKWNQNDWIQISQVRPATIAHGITKERVWFNQAHHFDLNPKFLGWGRWTGVKMLYCREHTRFHEIFFGNDKPIPRDEMYHVLDVMDNNTISFPWQKGDVLILDNVLAMHGRATFTGKRRILAAMTG